jgi:voltage-gated potassium channel
MTTKRGHGSQISQSVQSRPDPGLGRWLAHHFELPNRSYQPLPIELVHKLNIPTWLRASITVGVSFYLVFLALAYLDGFLFHSLDWRVSFLLPTAMIYLLLIIPVLEQFMTRVIDIYRALAPHSNKLRRLEIEAYALNRGREWLAVIISMAVGWLVLHGDPFLRDDYFSARFYNLVGEGLVFGLAGWHLYSAVVRTRLLSTMYDEAQTLSVFERSSTPYQPLLRWSLAVAGCLLGALVISFPLLPSRDFSDPAVILVNTTFLVSIILVLVFSRVPTSLLAQLRVLRAIFLFFIVALVGTIGFNQFEGWSPLDSFYATIITMATIGYGDFSPDTFEGKIFTIFLSLFAIGIGGYAITSIASFVIEGNFNRYIQGRRIDKQILQLRDHYILCGAGRMGKQIALELYKSKVPFVVIERSQEVLNKLLHEVDIPYIQGDATQDEVLQLAGVSRAKGLVAALSDDKDNVFIVLSARSFNSELRIISRLSTEKNRKKLQKAGTDTIVSPEEVSGRRMVAEMLNAEVVTLLDEMIRAEHQTGQTLRLEELHVDALKLPGLVERLERGELHIYDIGERTELMVVAVERCSCEPGEDRYVFSPRGNTKLQHGDILIVISTPEQRLRLYEDVLSEGGLRAVISKVAKVLDFK